MERIKLATPLFILREACAKDLFGVLDRLQGLGFDGCELLGFFGHEPEAIARHLRGANWVAMGNHVPFAEFDADFSKVLGDHKTIGCEYITIQLPKECMPDGEAYQTATEKIQRWAEALKAQGMGLLFHNHAGEFYPVEGGNALTKLMADAPALQLEPDIGWMAIAGEDPAEYLKRYADRAPVLHFKDYYRAPGADSFIFRPTGYGIAQFPALMELSLGCNPKWIVADHDDAYENDTYRELDMSLSYIRELIALHRGA